MESWRKKPCLFKQVIISRGEDLCGLCSLLNFIFISDVCIYIYKRTKLLVTRRNNLKISIMQNISFYSTVSAIVFYYANNSVMLLQQKYLKAKKLKLRQYYAFNTFDFIKLDYLKYIKALLLSLGISQKKR